MRLVNDYNIWGCWLGKNRQGGPRLTIGFNKTISIGIKLDIGLINK